MKRSLLFLILLISVFAAKAQNTTTDSSVLSKWRIGIATGYHANMMRFPVPGEGQLKSIYSERKGSHSGLFLISAEYSAPKNFSIRPELGFLKRGGELTLNPYGRVREGIYTLKATYFDIRVPVIYSFNLRKTKLQPYAYLAPVFGFTCGGKKSYISLLEVCYDGSIYGYDMRLSRANIAGAYFGMAIGGGVKYPINICGEACFINAEFSYELGFTDTYSKRERANNVSSVNLAHGPVASKRKFSGFELKVGFSVPLSLFKKKRPVKEEPKPVYVPKPVEKPVEKPAEKPCYTLKEIQQLVAEGKEVSGKTICAVDDIHFDIEKSAIKEESKPYLNQIVDVLVETGLYVEVHGHTDSTGSVAFNEKLSKDRALTVVKYLADRGLAWDRISYKFYGESKPLTTNETPEGRKLNRRVEFVLIKK